MKAPTETLAPPTIEEVPETKTSNPLPHLAMALVFAMIAGAVSIVRDVSPWGAVALVVTGAAAGYLTNKIAISLLFRPIKPRFGGKLYGMFYKRKAEFGEKLIDLSCERFVNTRLFEDLLRSEKIHKAMLDSVRGALTDFLKKDFGIIRESLDEILGSELRAKWTDKLSIELGEYACSAFASGFGADEFEETLADFLQAVGHKSATTIAQTEDLHTRLAHVMARKVRSSDLLGKVVEKLADVFGDWDKSGKTLGNLVPEKLQKRFEELVAGRLREWAMGALANYLAKEDNRRWIGEIAKQECERILWGKVESLNPIKKFIVQTFGHQDLNNAVSEIPSILDGYLVNLSGFLPGSPLEEQITQALKERLPAIWDLEIGKLKDWFTEEERQRMLDFIASRLNESEEGDLVEGGLARALKPLLAKPLEQLFAANESEEDLSEYTLKGVAEKVFRDEDLLEFLRVTFRIKARKCLQSFIERPVNDLLASPEAKDDIRKSLVEDIVPRLTDMLSEKAVGLTPHLPVREELGKIWNKLSNEDVRDSVEGALSREFSILINLGVSLGGMTGFLFAMANLFIS